MSSLEFQRFSNDFKLFLRTLTEPYIILTRNRKLTFDIRKLRM